MRGNPDSCERGLWFESASWDTHASSRLPAGCGQKRTNREMTALAWRIHEVTMLARRIVRRHRPCSPSPRARSRTARLFSARHTRKAGGWPQPRALIRGPRSKEWTFFARSRKFARWLWASRMVASQGGSGRDRREGTPQTPENPL